MCFYFTASFWASIVEIVRFVKNTRNALVPLPTFHCLSTLDSQFWEKLDKSNPTSKLFETQVRDNPKLLDDSGEVPKHEWSSWQFDSQLWNGLFTWRKN